MTVHFLNVGPERKTWSAEVQSISDAVLIDQIRRHGALMSRGIDFAWDDTGTEAGIFVGLVRRVGSVRVEGGLRV